MKGNNMQKKTSGVTLLMSLVLLASSYYGSVLSHSAECPLKQCAREQVWPHQVLFASALLAGGFSLKAVADELPGLTRNNRKLSSWLLAAATSAFVAYRTQPSCNLEDVTSR